jgi:outer membrane protein
MKIQTQIYLLILFILIIGGFLVYNYSLRPRIACMDLVKILSQSNEMTQLKIEFDGIEKNLLAKEDTMIVEIQTDIKEFEKNMKKYSEKEKKELSERINLKQSQFAKFKQANTEKMEQQRIQATEKVVQKINQIASDFAKSEGYKVLLGATGSGNIVYLDETYDITNNILKVLNRE